MGLLELFILAVGLSMDAFAVSVCKGLSVTKMEPKHALLCGAYFGGFQALMPALGYLLGSQFESMITQIDHWIAFVLLGIIGSSMIKESREDEEEEVSAPCIFPQTEHRGGTSHAPPERSCRQRAGSLPASPFFSQI